MRKIKKIKKTIIALCCSILIMTNICPAYGAYIDLDGASAILIEEISGKVLYAKDEHTRMYPASMTKMLTALIALEYLKTSELIMAGSEINEIPWDSSKANHENGETLSVENLIRGLIIPSGNETACIVAKAVAKRVKNMEDMGYSEAEKIFCQLMNEKAKSIGAVNSNFVNPHGYHNDNHYSTAYDMALIAREAIKNDVIRNIAAEKAFSGNGAGISGETGLKTKPYSWTTHNQLLIPEDEFYYQYATGIKTGYTGEAGDCLTASAVRDGKRLISVIMYSPDPGRWTDSVKLFEYGFDTYNYVAVQNKQDVLDNVKLSNFRLGEADSLELVAMDDFVDFLSEEELAAIKREIIFKPEYITPEEEKKDLETTETMLKAPIAAGSVVAEVKYTLNDEILFEGSVAAAKEVEPRTLKTDIRYYFDKIIGSLFSLEALPFWGGGVLALIIVVTIITKVRKSRRRSGYRYTRR